MLYLNDDLVFISGQISGKIFYKLPDKIALVAKRYA